MQYNWQQEDWPNFRYDLSGLEGLLLELAEGQGKISGLLQALPDDMKERSVVDILVAEAVKTSAIEGEYLNREEVLSSIRNNLGLNRLPEKIKDKRAEGVARLMVNARENYTEPLSETMLFTWHQMVMEPYAHINKGQWRSGPEPMQVVSGAAGKEIVHFEAPPSARVPGEMERLIRWFNRTAPGQPEYMIYASVRAAVAHLYFESIHPFEDGNGRIGRALSEKALSQTLGSPVLLSLSHAMEFKRKDYYQALKTAQQSNEITPWIRYFMQTILEAQELVTQQIRFTIAKSRFFDRFAAQLSPRQEKVLNRMLATGLDGFEGGMNAKKYGSIAKTSKATATRDLQHLAKIGALVPVGSGRSRRYEARVFED